MKQLLIALFFLSSLTSFAQNLEVVGGLNINSFYDFQQGEGHFNSTYKSDQGYLIMVGIDDIRIDWFTLGFTLSYDNYSGEIEAGDGGLGGGYETNIIMEKSIISIGVFPINFKILNNIDLNLGIEMSGLVTEDFMGTCNSWTYGQPPNISDLNDKYESYSAKTYFGVKGRIAYDLRIADKFSISPQYSYYYGLSNELDEFPEATKSMRHYFSIGLQTKI